MTTATTTHANGREQHGAIGPRKHPPATVGQAVRRHWIVASLPPLLLVALAVGIAFQRPPTYAAQARLNAGPVNASPQAIPGIAEASKSLAGTYARVVDAQAVIDPVSVRLKLEPGEVASRIEASPIPESSLILIEAKGPSSESAVALANATGDSLIRYAASLTRRNDDSPRLLEEFTQTSRSLQELVSTRRRLQAGATRAPTRAERAQLGRVEAEVEAVQLRLRTLSAVYQASQQGQASANLIQVLSPAIQADSDRIPVLQRLVLIALLAGIALGVALAVLRSRRPRRRTGEPHPASLADAPDAGDRGRTRHSMRIAFRFGVALLALALLAGGGAGAYLVLADVTGHGDQAAKQAPETLTTRSAAASRSPDPPRVTAGQARTASLRLVPAAPVWVCLVDAGGRRLVSREVRPGDALPTFRSERLRMSLGTSALSMRVNGRRQNVPAGGAPIGYEITPSGRKRLGPDAQPTCGTASASRG